MIQMGLKRGDKMLFNKLKTCLMSNIKKHNTKLQFKPENAGPVVDTVPIFQYPISSENDRRVYVWGLAEHGALGSRKQMPHEKNVTYMPKPRRLGFAEKNKVADIACGYGFTAFAVSSNKQILYGCGINTDSQLGFQMPNRKIKDDLVMEPTPIDLPVKNPSTRVIGIAGGRAHLLVLTNEGLFTLGNNAYGQCGRPVIPDERYSKSRVIHHIPDMKGKKVKSVTAGQDHSMILTENGEVFTFGWGADGQTGLAHYQNEHKPSLVKGDLAGQHIVKVACVADCVLALSDKGKVFGWGNSEYGQLPIAQDYHQINIATELNACKGLGHIVDIAAGGCFCMILNSEGDVYVWGYGILGLGPEVQKVSHPTIIPGTLFGKNPYQQNSKVIKIFCGMSHLAAVTNMGELYMWGCNKFGSLGLGHRNDQYFPLKVNVGARVQKVACGIDHTATICKPFI